MPQIVNSTYFQKANELNIPLSVPFITANPALETPNEKAFLDELCVKIEKELLINALGLATYNTLQLALADIDNPLYASYKKLVQGEEYDNKIWIGLDNDYSLIAWRILEQYLFKSNEQLTALGTVNVQPEKAQLKSPKYKIASANANFINGYQKGYLEFPIISFDGVFVDWFGFDNDTYVSLYQYLNEWMVSYLRCNGKVDIAPKYRVK